MGLFIGSLNLEGVVMMDVEYQPYFKLSTFLKHTDVSFGQFVASNKC